MPRSDPQARQADTAYRTLEDRRGRQLYRMAMWWLANGDRDVLAHMRDAIREWLAEDRQAGRAKPRYPQREVELVNHVVVARVRATKAASLRADRALKWAHGCKPKNK